MSSVIYNKALSINRAWLPIGTVSVKSALEDMNSSKNPKKALKIEYYQNDDGSYDLSKPTEIIPLSWEEWIELEPRKFDKDSIRTSKLNIRVPTVIICETYDKLPTKTFKPNNKNLYQLYKGLDYWTGLPLEPSRISKDHIISRDQWKREGRQGSPDNWMNVALTDKSINHAKGNMTPEAFMRKTGHKPAYKLKKPEAVTAMAMIKVLQPDWAHFIEG